MKASPMLCPLILLGGGYAQTVSTSPRAVVWRRIPAGVNGELVLTMTSRTACSESSPACWWNREDRLAITVQKGGETLTLTSAAGPNDDCYSRIERFTTQELVLSCVGEKWSSYDNRKFTYDLDARKLTGQFAYAPFSAEYVTPGPRIVITDKDRRLVVEIDPSSGEPRVTTAPVPPKPRDPDFALGGLPQTDIQTWAKARPKDAASYRRVEQAQIHEQVGPMQVEGSRVWFGKSFYNGEGDTGLGGFGYFDRDTAKYQLYTFPEIYDWSVSAILVERDVIWLALFHRGEYGNSPGGLLRWDRSTSTVKRWDVRSIASSIARAGGTTWLGTTDGIVSVHGDTVRSFLIDRTATGQDYIVER